MVNIYSRAHVINQLPDTLDNSTIVRIARMFYSCLSRYCGTTASSRQLETHSNLALIKMVVRENATVARGFMVDVFLRDKVGKF